MHNEESTTGLHHVRDLVSKVLKVNVGSLKRISPPGESTQASVYRTRIDKPARSVAVKVFSLANATQKAKDRVIRELCLAEWASVQRVGAPVLSVNALPQAALLTMDLAAGDLEGLLRLRQTVSYPFIKTVFQDAFSLVTDTRLVNRGLVCSDLKPANFLLFSKDPQSCIAFELASIIKKGGRSTRGLVMEVRLGDFDPYFWTCVDVKDAACLNRFVLLANCVLWRPPYKLGPYLPPEAFEMARAVSCRDATLLATLSKYSRLLQRGPFHYATRLGKHVSSLDDFLLVLQDSLRVHDLTP